MDFTAGGVASWLYAVALSQTVRFIQGAVIADWKLFPMLVTYASSYFYKAVVPSFNTDYMKHSIAHRVSIIWNALSQCLRNKASKHFCACAAIWFLIRRNTFQSWFLWRKSFSINLVRLVKVIITVLKNYLVICKGFERSMLCFMCPSSRNWFSWQEENECCFCLVAALFLKEKKRKKDRQTNIGNFFGLQMSILVLGSYGKKTFTANQDRTCV